MADRDPVPVELIEIVDGGNEQGHVRRCSGGRGNVDLAAIPGVAGVARVALRSPRGGGGELFPAVVAGGIVDAGRGPGWVIAEMKLPGTIEGCSAFAQAFDGERCRGRAGRGGENGAMDR